MTRILGLGDSTCDINIDNGMMYPGGQAMNVAVNARLCGSESGYLGCLGNDDIATHILQTLDVIGVDHSHCRIYQTPNEFWFYHTVDGDRVFLPKDQFNKSPFTAALRDMLAYEGFTQEDISYINTFDVVHTSEVSRIEPLLIQLSQLRPSLSFDLSLRYFDLTYLKTICYYTDIVLLSCSGQTDTEVINWLEKANHFGARIALATRGADASLCCDGNIVYRQETAKNTKVVDTLGAGDAFCGAFLSHYFNLNPQMAMEKNAVIQQALYLASLHAANICGKVGSFGYGMQRELSDNSSFLY